ncbi:hypothetical protein CCICO_01325 [Corynebacterium ciconiae DSM 44920]|uniref:helix-turn-helix transcriptional regulator n=1 Tax=Corynebacterium ciconiae TaxID=227319 RepID=UPI00037DCD4E|nr:hypothetical protein [Corynebacterium ciconiae]WKD60319.1 hypothetical protein CCICO_01325 [Corynebacterium ciconiae DSM 44920]
MNPTIIDTDTGRELWPAEQCAAHCGISRSTWTTYASRGQASAPKPVAHLGRYTLWDAAEVQAWHAARPSQRR